MNPSDIQDLRKAAAKAKANIAQGFLGRLMKIQLVQCSCSSTENASEAKGVVLAVLSETLPPAPKVHHRYRPRLGPHLPPGL